MEPGNEDTHTHCTCILIQEIYLGNLHIIILFQCSNADKHVYNKLCLFVQQLLEACVSNCGWDFQLELTKPSFHSDVRAILTGVRGSKFY